MHVARTNICDLLKYFFANVSILQTRGTINSFELIMDEVGAHHGFLQSIIIRIILGCGLFQKLFAVLFFLC